MNKGVAIIIFFCLLSLPALAQKYSTAAGIRFGNNQYGLTVKQRIFRTVSAEGLLTGNDRELIGTVLLLKHYPILGRGLNAYVGGGAHMGGLQDFGLVLGIDAMVGLELKFPFLPLIISADVKPAYHILHEDWFDFNTAVSVRYVFGKDKKKQRQRAREKRKRRREREKRRKNRDKEDQTFWEKIGVDELFKKKEKDGS
ncbi:MAG: hypothetical protein ACLFUB_11455 [Cyclobacteriaceae bacterium]